MKSINAEYAGGAVCRFEGLEARVLMAADAVMEWNQVLNNALAVDTLPTSPHAQAGPTRQSRAAAIVSAAVFDAVNAIDGTYTPYHVTDVHASSGASIEAAAAQAAHDTLSALFPYLKPTFDSQLAGDLSSIAAGRAKQGTAVGAAVAKEILAWRANDGSQIDAPGQPYTYVISQQPGDWRPDPLHPTASSPLTPDWGQVAPFGMLSATQFPAAPPPALDSKAYADAYTEVKNYGGDGITTPTLRTAEQTEIGMFWGYDGTPGMGTPPRLYNQIAESLAVQQHLTEVQESRLFALANIAIADAGITCWNDKFEWNVWRPITAIRENDPGTGPTGLGSGNPYLVGQGDPNWTPFGAPNDNGGGTNFTPPFPSYSSGHATFGGAVFTVFKDFFGTDNIHFTVASDEFNGITRDQNGIVRPVMTRSFDSFSQAMEENGQSRIYLGIHYSFDKVQGILCGTHIADFICGRDLLPVGKGQGRGSAAVVPPTPFSSTAIGSSGASSGDSILDQTLGKNGNSRGVLA
jgi:hypothetical protein